MDKGWLDLVGRVVGEEEEEEEVREVGGL